MKAILFFFLHFATARAEPRLLEVPLAPQTTNYSCGAAAMQSVLGYFGYRYSERELIRQLKTNPLSGTDHHEIVKFARRLNIDSEVRHNQTIDDIRKELDALRPVIVEFQAWPDGPLSVSYKDTWDQGHDAVVVGIDGKMSTLWIRYFSVGEVT